MSAPQTASTLTISESPWRTDFPVLDQLINDKPLAYLDNGATAQKPQVVIDSVSNYYRYDNANIHRGVHTLSERATRQYENARDKVRGLLNARSTKEIVFVRGATEAINLVAQSYGRSQFGAGDEILITTMEHHSNIVPWQQLCEQTGARLVVAPINDAGELEFDAFKNLISPRTKLVSVVHMSNALGTITPVREIIDLAHTHGIPVLLDGAQAAPHIAVDVQALDCDFYVFSGHKLCAPTGIGVLYAKEALLKDMPPYQGGGDMIRTVTFEKTTYNDLPYKFEAGTPNIAGAIGLGAAIDYLEAIGLDTIAAYEAQLLDYLAEQAKQISGLRPVGTAQHKASIFSFVLEDIHPHDIGTILDHEGVAIRAGHHCAMPVMARFKVPATARASLAFYNNRDDIDRLIAGLKKVQEIML